MTKQNREKSIATQKRSNRLQINSSISEIESSEKIKVGYITDFISGKQVKATPEETEAVQVFSKQLIEDYNYPREYIQTRPQFRVKARPSDTKKNTLLILQSF